MIYDDKIIQASTVRGKLHTSGTKVDKPNEHKNDWWVPFGSSWQATHLHKVRKGKRVAVQQYFHIKTYSVDESLCSYQTPDPQDKIISPRLAGCCPRIRMNRKRIFVLLIQTGT